MEGVQESHNAERSPGQRRDGPSVVASRRALVLPRPVSDPRFVASPPRIRAAERYTSAFACVPIVDRGRVLGTLSADVPRDLDPAPQAKLSDPAELVAQAAETMAKTQGREPRPAHLPAVISGARARVAS